MKREQTFQWRENACLVWGLIWFDTQETTKLETDFSMTRHFMSVMRSHLIWYVSRPHTSKETSTLEIDMTREQTFEWRGISCQLWGLIWFDTFLFPHHSAKETLKLETDMKREQTFQWRDNSCVLWGLIWFDAKEKRIKSNETSSQTWNISSLRRLFSFHVYLEFCGLFWCLLVVSLWIDSSFLYVRVGLFWFIACLFCACLFCGPLWCLLQVWCLFGVDASVLWVCAVGLWWFISRLFCVCFVVSFDVSCSISSESMLLFHASVYKGSMHSLQYLSAHSLQYLQKHPLIAIPTNEVSTQEIRSEESCIGLD